VWHQGEDRQSEQEQVTMLRYSLVLVAGLVATGTAGAATWADGLFDELSKDFGSVPRGPTLVHHFNVVNNTRSAVHISSVRVSCGCVSASALNTFLRPGESTSILARMDTNGFIGMKSVTIYVHFDRPRSEEVRLWVRANGRNDFTVTPDTLALGQVKRTTTPSATVTLTFYGHGGARILEAKGDSNYIQPTVTEVRRLDSEVVYQLTARLRGDTPVGRWYTDVWLKTNVPSMEQLRVPLTVEVVSALSVTPEVVALGAIKVNNEVERRVIVRGVRPFKITRILGTNSDLWIKDSAVTAKEIHVLTIRYKPGQVGELTRTVRILTDLGGDDGEIDFRITGFVAAEPPTASVRSGPGQPGTTIPR
jgi:hypothetical protein